MDWVKICLLLVGAVMCLEGAFMLSMSRNFWDKFREHLAQFEVGQIHTLGLCMLVFGATIALSAYFFL